jgi:hypothetical protein
LRCFKISRFWLRENFCVFSNIFVFGSGRTCVFSKTLLFLVYCHNFFPYLLELERVKEERKGKAFFSSMLASPSAANRQLSQSYDLFSQYLEKQASLREEMVTTTRPSSLLPHPSCLLPRPSSLVLRPSSLIPHP